jgi:hypothetical protein
MILEMPSEVHVQILVVPTNAKVAPIPDAPDVPRLEAPPRRSRHRMFKYAAVLALMGTAFYAGHHVSQPVGAVETALAQPGPVVPSPALRAPLSQPPAGPAASVPSAFDQQLRQPPVVTRPPGAPSATAGNNPFGLED